MKNIGIWVFSFTLQQLGRQLQQRYIASIRVTPRQRDCSVPHTTQAQKVLTVE